MARSFIVAAFSTSLWLDQTSATDECPIEQSFAQDIKYRLSKMNEHFAGLLSGQGEQSKIVKGDFKPIELGLFDFYGVAVDCKTQQVITDKPWFIEFMAPWCPHS